MTFELIANTPVDDGLTWVWHGALAQAQNVPHSEEDIAAAREIQAGALHAFAADFDVWKHKRPAIKIMQLKKDGPFKHVRKWYGQFYDERGRAGEYHGELNGAHHILEFDRPGEAHSKLDEGLFGT